LEMWYISLKLSIALCQWTNIQSDAIVDFKYIYDDRRYWANIYFPFFVFFFFSFFIPRENDIKFLEMCGLVPCGVSQSHDKCDFFCKCFEIIFIMIKYVRVIIGIPIRTSWMPLPTLLWNYCKIIEEWGREIRSRL
jgi:hypothetical protein